jgi:hypothetical protein
VKYENMKNMILIYIFAEYIPEDVFLNIKNKLDDTLLYISKKYNLKQHTEMAYNILKEKWQKIHGRISNKKKINCYLFI